MTQSENTSLNPAPFVSPGALVSKVGPSENLYVVMKVVPNEVSREHFRLELLRLSDLFVLKTPSMTEAHYKKYFRHICDIEAT